MNVQKTALASAIGLTLGIASSAANAFWIKPHTMTFSETDTYLATGNLCDTTNNSKCTGVSSNYGTLTSVDPFFYHTWNAEAVAFFGTHSQDLTWAGSSAAGDFSYNFHLTGGQIAFGTLFNWSTSSEIAVLAIMDCGGSAGNNSGVGTTCTGITTVMDNGPFQGSKVSFSGDIHSGTVPFSGGSAAVPIPAAAWLFGSGLVGLAGISRRRKKD